MLFVCVALCACTAVLIPLDANFTFCWCIIFYVTSVQTVAQVLSFGRVLQFSCNPTSEHYEMFQTLLCKVN
jgi:hypothetical protein